MVEIRRILCPVDFSDVSLHAFTRALALARAHRAEITALHVMPLHMPPLSALAVGTAGTLDPETREKMRKDLDDRLRTVVGSGGDGTRVETVVEQGNVANEIAAQARARNADLVVVGTHGHGGFEKLTLGSTAEKTQRKAPCPVLTVPPRADSSASAEGSYARIVCAMDFSGAARRALEYATALARQADGRVVLLHVVESAGPATPEPVAARAASRELTLEDRAERLRRIVPPADQRWLGREEVAVGKTREEILKAAERLSADLIVMGVHGETGLEHALFGSTAYHVVRRARCPVLTVRDGELTTGASEGAAAQV
jgi:nucleotide-binding universal stress UspA family protein